MWISKRKWNEMEDKISVLEKRDARLWEEWAKLKVISDGLAMAHKDEITKRYSKDGCEIYAREYLHEYESTVNTSNISDITLEELARLVIDHEPIVREENVKVKVEYR